MGERRNELEGRGKDQTPSSPWCSPRKTWTWQFCYKAVAKALTDGILHDRSPLVPGPSGWKRVLLGNHENEG